MTILECVMKIFIFMTIIKNVIKNYAEGGGASGVSEANTPYLDITKKLCRRRGASGVSEATAPYLDMTKNYAEGGGIWGFTPD